MSYETRKTEWPVAGDWWVFGMTFHRPPRSILPSVRPVRVWNSPELQCFIVEIPARFTTARSTLRRQSKSGHYSFYESDFLVLLFNKRHKNERASSKFFGTDFHFSKNSSVSFNAPHGARSLQVWWKKELSHNSNLPRKNAVCAFRYCHVFLQ